MQFSKLTAYHTRTN